MNVRRPTEADAPAVTALIRAVEERFAGKPEQSEQDLRAEWAELDLAADAWLGLGVDVQNPTGATRLYERAGMHVSSSFVYFEKALAG